jgi:putative salt-induced outer membrane protein YdiY
MRILNLIITALTMLALTAGLSAQEKNWTDKAELSYVQTGGNTEIMTLSARNELGITFSEKLTGSWKLGTVYGKTGDVKTAESYFTEFGLDYHFTERVYLGLIAGWLKNEFAGLDSRIYAGPAFGWTALTGPEHTLDWQVGGSYISETYFPEGTDPADYSYMAALVRGNYQWAISEQTAFTEAVELLYDFSDSENYNLTSETAIQTALSSLLSLKVGYTIKFDNAPMPDTLESSDTILSVTLVANF